MSAKNKTIETETEHLLFIGIDRYRHAMNLSVHKVINPGSIPAVVDLVDELKVDRYSFNLKKAIYNVRSFIRQTESIVVIHEGTSFNIFANIDRHNAYRGNIFFHCFKETDKDYDVVKKLITQEKKEMILNIEHPDIIIRSMIKGILNNWTFIMTAKVYNK